jgi:hypothetical protein
MANKKIFVLALNVDLTCYGGSTIDQIVAISPNKAKLEKMMRELEGELEGNEEDDESDEERKFYTIDEHETI